MSNFLLVERRVVNLKSYSTYLNPKRENRRKKNMKEKNKKKKKEMEKLMKYLLEKLSSGPRRGKIFFFLSLFIYLFITFL